MKVDITDISPVRKKIEVEIPPEKVSQEIEAFLRKLNKEIRIKGFRPGKAPAGLLKSRYRDYWEEEVSHKLIDDSYQKIIEEKALQPVSEPQVDREEIREGEGFKYSALVEVKPRVEPQEYLGLKLTRKSSRVKPEMVDSRLEAIREDQAKIKPLEEGRGLRDKDLAVVDVEGEITGAPEKRFSRKGLNYIMGSSTFPYSFCQALVGAEVGERREFRVNYPPEHGNEELRGREVSFKVEVKEIKEVVQPDLDDNLAQALGYQSLEELRKRVATVLAQELEAEAQRLLEQDAKQILVAANPFDIPESMMEKELEARLAAIRERLAPGSREPNWERLRQELRNSTEREIKADFILEALASKEGLQVSEEELEEELEKIANQAVRQRYQREVLRENFKQQLVLAKALKFVLDKADVASEEEE